MTTTMTTTMTTIWRCKDGRELRVCDMETDHLWNSVAMLRRNGRVTPDEWLDALGSACSLNGEFAQMAAEQELAGMRVSRSLAALEHELRSRKGR